VAAWEADDAVAVERARSTLSDILADDTADLARLSVGPRVIRTLLR
jgi:glutamate dehydrogenase